MAVEFLADHQQRVPRLDRAEDEPAIHQVARIVSQRHRPGRDEHGVIGIPQLDRVDAQVREEAAGNPADRQSPVKPAIREPRRVLAAVAWSVPLWGSIAFGVWGVATAFRLPVPFSGSFLVIAFLVIGKVSLQPLFNAISWLLPLISPAIAMRTFAEESRTGTLEMLITQPVRDWEVVVGKWLAAMALLATNQMQAALYAMQGRLTPAMLESIRGSSLMTASVENIRPRLKGEEFFFEDGRGDQIGGIDRQHLSASTHTCQVNRVRPFS